MTDRDKADLLRRLTRAKVNRRGFLAAAGLSGTAAFLAACARNAGTSPTATAGSAATASAAASASAAAGGSGGPEPSYATEGALYMYNWSDYVAEENIAEFQERYNITDWTYDTFASNEELLTKMQAGGTGLYDTGAPTAEFVKALVDGGFIDELDFSRIPNAQHINARFQNFYPEADAKYNAYHLPKDWGTTGIGIRTKAVTEDIKSWKQFFEVAPKYSGRIVMVDSPGDVLTAPLKALGYSLNSTDPGELEEARELLRSLAPHVLALDSDTYADRLASEEAVLGLVWTGGVVDLRDEEETADTVYTIPEDGTLFWLDTWVKFKDAPHPEATYAFLNFIHEPEIQAVETEWNRYATPNDAAIEFVDQEILDDPAVFVPEDVVSSLEGAQDVSSDPLRAEIWEEFKSSIGG